MLSKEIIVFKSWQIDRIPSFVIFLELPSINQKDICAKFTKIRD